MLNWENILHAHICVCQLEMKKSACIFKKVECVSAIPDWLWTVLSVVKQGFHKCKVAKTLPEK